jgi:hypothetical protein
MTALDEDYASQDKAFEAPKAFLDPPTARAHLYMSMRPLQFG